MKRFLISSLLSGMSIISALAGPSVLSIRDTITDNNIIYPESFDTDLKELRTNWYLQRYAVIDSMANRKVVTNVSDKEYISRLQRLPTVIGMPYNSIVRQYIEMYAMHRQELVEKMLSLGLYYNPIFEDALERYGLPMELKYLPIIESALNPNAVSKSGAAGLWQFMPSTAAGEGLDVNSLIDERRDPYKSSDAAACLLKKYHEIFNDWHLTLAAYNCGPGNVNKAIKSAGGKRDFWEIYAYLPKETRGYVPAFIAANYIMNYFGAHGISPAVARSPIVTDSVHVCKRVHFKQIADVMGISVEELRILNPQYRQDVIPGNIKPYPLILPSVQAYCYKANEDTILMHDRNTYEPKAAVEPNTGRYFSQSELEEQEMVQNNSVSGTDSKGAYIDEPVVKYHVVKQGETLASIAKLYGTTPESIREANDLSSTKIKRGKKLKINSYNRVYASDVAAAPSARKDTVNTVNSESAPVAVSTVSAPAAPQTAPKQSGNSKSTAAKTPAKTYAVKSGDSLERIATRNGVTVADLKRANNLTSDIIRPGQKLTIPSKSSASAASAKKSTASKKSTPAKKGTKKRKR